MHIKKTVQKLFVLKKLGHFVNKYFFVNKWLEYYKKAKYVVVQYD